MVSFDPQNSKKPLKCLVKNVCCLSRGCGLGRDYALPVSQIFPLSKKMAGGGRGNGEIESFHKELEHILLL